MKVLKGFASVLLAGIMLVCLIAISGVLMFRVFLSGPSLAKIAKGMVEQDETFEISTMFDGAEFNSSDLDDMMDELDEYISKDQMYEEVGELASQIIRYEIGVIDDIDGSSLKETLKEAAKKYEKKTGEDVDFDELEDNIDDAIKDLKKELKQSSDVPQDVANFFKVFYSNGILIGCIIVFVVCAILIVVMFKSVTPLLIHLAILGFLHGITNGALGLVMSAIPAEDESMKFVIGPLKSIFLTTAFICIAVAVISIILIIILGVVKKNKQAPVQYQVQQ